MGKTQQLPHFQPMLATRIETPFDDPAWEFEIKWDGYRTLAYLNGKAADLRSRNDLSFNARFPPIFQALGDWNIQAVVDGEIVAVNADGLAEFGRLQNWNSPEDGTLLYYVFDLLWLDGQSLLNQPLSRRRELLHARLPGNELIRPCFYQSGNGKEFFHAIQKMGMEGMIAKRSDSIYHPGRRTPDWLKIKSEMRQEVVIGGYLRIKDSPRPWSSLLLGVYDRGKFRYVGKVGTGFNESTQQKLLKLFRSKTRKTSPFHLNEPILEKALQRGRASHYWLSPSLVCEVRYTSITKDGVFRHPAFVSMRDDKDASQVVQEKGVN